MFRKRSYGRGYTGRSRFSRYSRYRPRSFRSRGRSTYRPMRRRYYIAGQRY